MDTDHPVTEAYPDQLSGGTLSATVRTATLPTATRVERLAAKEDEDNKHWTNEGDEIFPKSQQSEGVTSTDPSVISVKFYKKKPTVEYECNNAFGLFFRRQDGQIYITAVIGYYFELDGLRGDVEQGMGPAILPPLQEGDMVLWADNCSCSNWSPSSLRNYIVSKGYHPVTLTVRRPNGNPNLALAAFFRRPGRSYYNPVSNIQFTTDAINRLRLQLDTTADQEFCSILEQGDLVQSINDVDTTSQGDVIDPETASLLIESAERKISILVKKKDVVDVTVRRNESMTNTERSLLDYFARYTSDQIDSPIEAREKSLSFRLNDADVAGDMMNDFLQQVHPEFPQDPGFVSVSTYKPSQDTTIGLSFSTLNGKTVISRVSKKGALFSHTPLGLHMELISINHTDPSKFSRLHEYVKKAPVGPICVIARNPEGSLNLCQSLAYKSSPNASVGIMLRRSSNHRQGGDSLYIDTIDSNGIFADSILNVGDTLLTINGISCDSLQPDEALKLAQKVDTTAINIVVRTSAASVVVCSSQVGSMPSSFYPSRTAIPASVSAGGSTPLSVIGGRRGYNEQRRRNNNSDTGSCQQWCLIFALLVFAGFIVLFLL